MISIKFTNLKSITSHLLVKDTFDGWLLTEGQIYTHSLFTINGRVNPDFTIQAPSDALDSFNRWLLLRPVCYEIIKGKQLPTFFKFVFKLPSDRLADIAGSSGGFNVNDIDGLFINIKYDKGIISLTTGISLKVFTLDKTPEKVFDSYVLNIMDSNKIEYTIL
jgi:hypothetical protein